MWDPPFSNRLLTGILLQNIFARLGTVVSSGSKERSDRFKVRYRNANCPTRSISSEPGHVVFKLRPTREIYSATARASDRRRPRSVRPMKRVARSGVRLLRFRPLNYATASLERQVSRATNCLSRDERKTAATLSVVGGQQLEAPPRARATPSEPS